jgi:hypothetical protein
MAPGQKYSVKISDAELDSYKETFMMFDKVGQEDPIVHHHHSFLCRMVMEQFPPRS